MLTHSGVSVYLILSHFPDTFAADILPAEGDQIPERTAENTGRLKFLQNDPVIFHVDFQLIPFGDVQ